MKMKNKSGLPETKDGNVIIDVDHDIPVYSLNCNLCKHYNINTSSKVRLCKAFPDGIPLNIWLGKINHLSPTKEQTNSIVFEKLKG